MIPMILQAIQTQIALAADMEALIRRVNSSPKYRKQTATLQGRLDAAKKRLRDTTAYMTAFTRTMWISS